MVAAIKARVGSISVGVAAVLVWGVLLNSCLPVQAQEPQNAATPVLTIAEREGLENRILKLEAAAREMSPEAIGKAIEELMKARQSTYQQTANELNTFTAALAKPGWQLTRDQSGAFVYVPVK